MKSRSYFSVAYSFLALIAIGAVILATPFCRANGQWGDWLSSLFTACSAVCVTGLSMVDIGSAFNIYGQIVLLILVEFGCLGLMMCGTFLLIAIGRRLSLSSEFSLMNAYGVEQVKGVKSLICWVIGSMLAFETIGAGLLYLSLGNVYESIFFSVMGFCNAGFSLYPDSLLGFANQPAVVMVMALETILGSMGFMVLFNLFTFKFHRRSHLSLQTRVVLHMTILLLLVTWAAFLICEWGGTLGGMPLLKKLYISFYQAVTPRTCGFSIIPTESVRPITRLIYQVMMFIGGAPGSAAAGVKVTTCAVLVYTLCALCRGDTETIIRKRVIPNEIVRESIVIFMAISTFIVVVTGILLVTEDGSHLSTDALVFEAVSAITTTGLSMGDTTASLSLAGKICIMVAMFIGRLGALSVVMMIGDREMIRHIRFPVEELVVG